MPLSIKHPFHRYSRLLQQLLVWVMTMCFAGELIAQTQGIPNSGRLFRENQRDYLPPEPSQSLPLPQVEQKKTRPNETLKIPVKTFRVLGSRRFSADELQQLIAPLAGKDLTLAQLRQATDAIAEYYRVQGYLARVYLPEQSLKSGIVVIAVAEARVGEVRIELPDGKERIPKAYAQRFLKRQLVAGEAVNLNRLQRVANILNDTPGMDANLALAKGKSRGETDVVMRLRPDDPIKGMASLDNYGSKSTGEARAGVNLYLNSPFGFGDQLQFTGNVSEGNDYGRVEYSLPLGDDGWRLALRASRLRYELGDDFSSLDAHGDATSEGAGLMFPVWRSGSQNLYWTMGFDARHYEDLIHSQTISKRETEVFNAGFYGDTTDLNGFTLYGVSLSSGELELDNREEKSIDELTRKRQGRFNKIAINASLLHSLLPKQNMWLSFNGQWADSNLDSSEQMSLGGPTGVRAYPALEGNGDNAQIVTLEWRYLLEQSVFLAIFYDHGWITQHKSKWTNWNFGNPSLDNHYQLGGAGWGLNWSVPDQFLIKLDVAWPVGDNPARNPITNMDADGTQREPRLWFGALKYF